MKRTKKLTAVAAVAAVISSLFPSGIAASAQSDNTLFTEDFESYEVGTIIEAASDQTTTTRVGNIDYQLRAGDKLEIAEENGNKYLKITRASTSATNSHIKYYFPETYSDGTYTISYDFRPDVHNRYFARFGSFIRTSGINLTTISYGNDVYANNGTNASYYIGNLLNSANYTGTKFATIKQTVDLKSASDNYTFNAVYPDSSGGTAEKTVTNTANQLGITGLAWAIQKNTNNNFNGPDDASSAAVYRIDNIKVESPEPETASALELSSTNIANNGKISSGSPFVMTFSEAVQAADVTLQKNGAAMASGDYTVTVSGADVSVIPTGGWEDGAVYTVNVGSITSDGCSPFEGTVFTLTGSSNLFTEDFESYEVGTIVEAASDQSSSTRIGNIDYQLRAGDKLEIAEENGNKYLKITRASESSTSSHIKYYFPETYSDGKYSVSYDFRPDVHNRYFARFGSFIRTSGINLTTISYGNNVYANGSTSNSAYYIGNLLKSANYTGTKYATITQTVDLTSASDNYTFNAVYPGSSGTDEKTVTNTANQLGITGLAWAIQKNTNNNYNGPDDASSAAVYRIDNITVKEVPLELVSVNVENNGKISGSTSFTMTFSGTVSEAEITLKQDGTDMDSGDYTVTVSGDTVSVLPSGGWKEGSQYTVIVDRVASSGTSPFEGATFTLRANSDLFSEDFESYPIGVIASGDVNTVSTTRNPGGLVYKLAEGDTLEVVEKDGSKVLKLTAAKDNTTVRRLLLDFDRHYGDNMAYDVSFDYYVENNSVWFSDFGTVYDDKISGHSDYVHTAYYSAIKPVSSYRDDLYFDRNTKKYYGGGLLDASDEFWKHQNTMIDFSEEPMPFIIRTTKTTDGAGLAQEAMTVSQTYGKQTADNISSIAWGFQTNTIPEWNGQDEGSGVYYIDNITVRSAKLRLLGTNIGSDEPIAVRTDISLEFNGAVSDGAADHITVKKDGTALPASDYSVALSDDKKTVTISPVAKWAYDSTYVIEIGSIEGLVLEAFEGASLEFDTQAEAEAVYADNMALSRTETDNVYDFSAVFHNDTDKAQSYQPIIVLINRSDGSFAGFKLGESGVLEANSSCDISIPEINADLSIAECELLIWEDLTNLKPVTTQKSVTDVKESQ